MRELRRECHVPLVFPPCSYSRQLDRLRAKKNPACASGTTPDSSTPDGTFAYQNRVFQSDDDVVTDKTILWLRKQDSQLE
jgi:hypothetical protein